MFSLKLRVINRDRSMQYRCLTSIRKNSALCAHLTWLLSGMSVGDRLSRLTSLCLFQLLSIQVPWMSLPVRAAADPLSFKDKMSSILVFYFDLIHVSQCMTRISRGLGRSKNCNCCSGVFKSHLLALHAFP